MWPVMDFWQIRFRMQRHLSAGVCGDTLGGAVVGGWVRWPSPQIPLSGRRCTPATHLHHPQGFLTSCRLAAASWPSRLIELKPLARGSTSGSRRLPEVTAIILWCSVSRRTPWVSLRQVRYTHGSVFVTSMRMDVTKQGRWNRKFKLCLVTGRVHDEMRRKTL